MALHKSITNREFKILLKPENLDRLSTVNQFVHLVHDFVETTKVSMTALENAATSLRNVYFIDTPDQQLRGNNLILRVRESRHNVWVDDWCEVTLKCRAPTLKQSRAFDPAPNTAYKFRLRLKEEVLRGKDVGESSSIYSNNAILDAVPVDLVFERKFGTLMAFFPELSGIDVHRRQPLQIVGGRKNKVLEALLPLGNLSFGAHVTAHFDLAIWMRSVGEPIVGELAFSYRVNDLNREDDKAHARADRFYRSLQLALPHWLHHGATKTALVYEAVQ